jgi:hypothetical protein
MRGHRVEKVGVFAVHISRATRLFEVEQSRTNGRDRCSGALQF